MSDRSAVRALLAIGLDVLVVLVFAGIGRASHHESNPVLDALTTAWPFIVGVAVGWLVVRAASGQLPMRVRTGWPVWLSTVVVGMLLRQLTDRGMAFAFVVVATVFLGIFLLGWRVVAGFFARRAARV